MSKVPRVAAAKVVVVIAPFELADHLQKDFKTHGAHGFTVTRADGAGSHGPRTYGVLDGANVRFEVITTTAVADAILHHVASAFADRGVIAYAHAVDAVPADHFG
jgi:nitrogen regulatory protein PII